MSDLQVQPSGDVLQVRFDAPARRNALSLETVEDLHDVLTEHVEPTLLLGSSTDGIFCAGADLDTDDATRTRLSDLLYACYAQMVTRPGVVIAAVTGAAVGGGAQLSAAADIRTCSAAARWRWVGPGHGLAVGAWILPDLVGRSRGLDLALTSRWLGADEAVAVGFVGRIDVDPWQRAHDIATDLALADPAALARVKQVATRPGLLERLADERQLNRASWTGWVPTARQAARDGRGIDGSSPSGI